MPQPHDEAPTLAPRPPDLDTLPSYISRPQAAELHTKHYGPLRPRTLESWPLTWRTVNGRALVETAEFVAEAQRRFDAAPVWRSGRDPDPGKPPPVGRPRSSRPLAV
jgi:hypothetical protein